MLVISLLSEALEYQRCCNDRTICEQFMSLIVRTCIHCKLSWQLFYVCWQFSFFHIEYFYLLSYVSVCLQGVNPVGLVAGRASGLVGGGSWQGYLSGARCTLAYGPADATVSCFSKIQIGFTFLVCADPGSLGQRAVKRVCVCGMSH